MNPMMLPFLMYQRWLEMFFVPLLNHMEAASNSAMSQAKAMQSEVIDKTKQVAQI